MAETLFNLFDDFAVRYARGEHPDVRDYLNRAGAQQEELARLLERFLEAVPPPQPDEATVTLVGAWLDGRQPLSALLDRSGMKREEAVEKLAEALGLERGGRHLKLRNYLERLERGALDVSRIDRRVWEALSQILGAPASYLRECLKPPTPQPSVVLERRIDYRRHRGIVVTANEPGSSKAQDAPRYFDKPVVDEVDQLFLGGPSVERLTE